MGNGIGNNDGPSRQTMDELPGRALTFLRGAGTSPSIRTILAAHGYTEEEHELGWKLLHKVSGYAPAPGPATIGVDVDDTVRKAIAELDAWDEPNFERIENALLRAFPKQAAFVFDGLEPAQGAGAVVSVGRFLQRVDALERDPARKATRKEDLAAVKLLEQRGITKTERERLQALVDTAQKGTAPLTEAPDPQSDKARAEHDAALRELYLWHKDWSSTARACITRRDHLIRLGLAKKRKKREKKPAGTPSNPV